MLLSMQWGLRVRGLRRGGVVPEAWTRLGAEGCVRSLVALRPASLARLPGRSARQGVRCWASARRVTLAALMGLIVGTDVRRRPASTREHLFEAVLRYRCLLPMSMMGWRCRGRWSGGQRPQEELAVRWEAALLAFPKRWSVWCTLAPACARTCASTTCCFRANPWLPLVDSSVVALPTASRMASITAASSARVTGVIAFRVTSDSIFRAHRALNAASSAALE